MADRRIGGRGRPIGLSADRRIGNVLADRRIGRSSEGGVRSEADRRIGRWWTPQLVVDPSVYPSGFPAWKTYQLEQLQSAQSVQAGGSCCLELYYLPSFLPSSTYSVYSSYTTRVDPYPLVSAPTAYSWWATQFTLRW